MIGRLDGRHRIIALVVLAQVLVLVVIALLQGARIADGTEVRVAVRPIDPIDFARGNYVDLRYGFEELPLPDGARRGDDAYVVLGPAGADGVRVGERIELEETALEPGDLWITLSIDDRQQLDVGPISSYYGSGAVSRRLEQELVDGGVATLSLGEDGSPRLVDVS